MTTNQEIYDAIENHADNGIPPHLAAVVVSEDLNVSIERVTRVLRQWLVDAGWHVEG